MKKSNMKQLTKDEFEARTAAMLEARNIFIDSGVTKSINIAFDIYLSILSGADHVVVLNNMTDGGRRGSPLDEYDRLECPQCGAPMLLQIFKYEPDSPVKSRMFCPSNKCDTAYDSDRTLEQWKEVLKKKEPENEDGPGSAGTEKSQQK